MKIAMYTYGSSDSMIFAYEEYREAEGSQFIRTSEIVEVEFKDRSVAEVVPLKLAALDETEKQMTAKHLSALSHLKEMRAKLLAISAPEAT